MDRRGRAAQRSLSRGDGKGNTSNHDEGRRAHVGSFGGGFVDVLPLHLVHIRKAYEYAVVQGIW